MVNSRVLLTLLIMCSVLMPLTVPETHSQTITTVTSTQYATSSYVTTWYSSIQMTVTSAQSVRYEYTPYGYNDQTCSFSLSQFMETIPRTYDESDVEVPCVYYDYFLLNATRGHEIRGHFEAFNRPPYAVMAAPVYFYILSLDQLRRFKASYCGSDRSIWPYAYASSYDLDWVVQQSGEYALLFVAPDLPYYGTISFTANDYVRTVQSSSITYTTTSTYTLQSVQIAVSTQSNITPQSSTSPYLVPLIVAIVVVAIIIPGLMILRKRMKHQGQ